MWQVALERQADRYVGVRGAFFVAPVNGKSAIGAGNEPRGKIAQAEPRTLPKVEMADLFNLAEGPAAVKKKRSLQFFIEREPRFQTSQEQDITAQRRPLRAAKPRRPPLESAYRA